VGLVLCARKNDALARYALNNLPTMMPRRGGESMDGVQGRRDPAQSQALLVERSRCELPPKRIRGSPVTEVIARKKPIEVALPREAQRLGLEADTSDLNPVGVLIKKAMIGIPPEFAGRPPVNPEVGKNKELIDRKWKGAQGLAEDVRYCGKGFYLRGHNVFGCDRLRSSLL